MLFGYDKSTIKLRFHRRKPDFRENSILESGYFACGRVKSVPRCPGVSFGTGVPCGLCGVPYNADMVAPQKTKRPTKPYGKYKLRAHANGSWCKKLKGKLHYLGPWDCPEDAEKRWERILRADSEQVDIVEPDDLAVADLCTLFYRFKEREVDRGSISDGQCREYKRLCQLIVDSIGADVLVSDLSPGHFGRLRQALDRKGYVPTTMSKKIIQLRAVFQWAMRNGHTDGKILIFGDELQVPTRRELRQFKENKRIEKGTRMFEAEEILRLLDAADEMLSAAIWLGYTAGFGHADLARLRSVHIDFDAGWISMPRSKTGVPRKAKLIPEATQALQDILDGDELFKMNAADVESDLIGRRFRVLQQKVGCWREGRGHYGLRHSCRTVLDELMDPVVAGIIMGHVDESTASNYIQRIDNSRFEKAAEHLRSWLLG